MAPRQSATSRKIRNSAEEMWNSRRVVDPNRINTWVTKESLTEKQAVYDEGGGLFRLKRPKIRPKKVERK